MRKVSYLLNFFVIICMLGFSGCNEGADDVSGEYNKVSWLEVENVGGSTLSLERGSSFAIKLILHPNSSTDKDEYTFQYKSSDESVATISEAGVISTLAAGVSAISIVPSHNSKLGFSFTLNVFAGYVAAEEVVLSEDLKEGLIIDNVGKTFNLSEYVSVLPRDVVNKKVIYSTDNKEVATIDESGLITGLAAGTAVITIVSAENPNILTTVSVEVQIAPAKELNRKGWLVTEASEYLAIGSEIAESVKNNVIDGNKETSIRFDKAGKGNRPAGDKSLLFFVIDRNNKDEYHSFRVVQTLKSAKACVTALTIYGRDSEAEDWKMVKTNISIPNQDAGADSGVIDIKGSTPHTHRYIKVEVVAWNESSSPTTEIAEFHLIGS